MRAVQITAPGHVESVEAPTPSLKPGHALVRPTMVALCGSDVRTVFYAPEEEYPRPVGASGHEIIGTVEAIDAADAHVRVGDAVLALTEEETGMAEALLTEAENVLPLPGGRPLEHLLMAQQLGTVIYSCKRLPNIVGKDVAVVGQGSGGLFFDWMLRRMGARRVIGLDVVEARVAAGLRFGATHVVNVSRTDALRVVEKVTEGRLADLVVEATGEPEAINLAPRLMKVGGHLHCFGILRGPHRLEFDYWTLFRKYGSVTTLGHSIGEPGKASFKMALDLVARGEVDVSSMITHRLPFERVPEAYELARTRGDGAIKIVVYMPGFDPDAPR